MYTNNKWNILMLDLDCHSQSKALEGADPINTKTHQLWSQIFLLQISLCHQGIHDQ